MKFGIFNALVICNHGPYGAGNSGGIAGLKYQDFTFEVSRQCRGKAGLLIPAKTAGENSGAFRPGFTGLQYRVLSEFWPCFEVSQDSRL